jgi:hypothetical protein
VAFKNPFWGSDDEKEKPAAKTVVATKAEPVPVPKPIVTVVPGQADPDMIKILEDAISESNLPGFDYIEFRDSMARMSGVPMTEEQKYQAVFATAQSIGATKQTLLDAVDHYLKVIDGKHAEFQDFVGGIQSTEVTSKEKIVADLNSEIESEAAEIQRLTQSIQEKRQKQDATNLEIVQSKQNIQNKMSAFEASKAMIVNTLTSDKTKISTYLK